LHLRVSKVFFAQRGKGRIGVKVSAGAGLRAVWQLRKLRQWHRDVKSRGCVEGSMGGVWSGDCMGADFKPLPQPLLRSGQVWVKLR